MARGKKYYSLEEQMDKIIAEIESTEESLKELKRTKKELEEQIRLNRLSELDELISASGKSIEEVKAMLGGE